MAKRRILKKEISYVAGELFTEALVCKLYIPGVNQEKADALMARILDMQDSYIVRAGHPDGKDNKALVRNYYRKLRVTVKVLNSYVKFKSVYQYPNRLSRGGWRVERTKRSKPNIAAIYFSLFP